eukprot:4433167-Prymnesium_polylepis.1
MCSISPQSSTTTGWRVAPPPLPTFSIASTTSRPDDTLPKTTCFPSKCGVERVVRKNCAAEKAAARGSNAPHRAPRRTGSRPPHCPPPTHTRTHSHSHSRSADLRAVCVGAGVGHREQKRLRVADVTVLPLVVKLGAVDRLAARAVARREVAALPGWLRARGYCR